MRGQAQIVVGTEVQDLAAIVEPYCGILNGDDDALLLEQTLGFNGAERIAEGDFMELYMPTKIPAGLHMRVLKSWMR